MKIKPFKAPNPHVFAIIGRPAPFLCKAPIAILNGFGRVAYASDDHCDADGRRIPAVRTREGYREMSAGRSRS